MIYRWDPKTSRLTQVADMGNVVPPKAGQPAWTKVHARIDEGKDGGIYFSCTLNAGQRAGDPKYQWNERLPGGQLYRYDPKTNKTKVFSNLPAKRCTATSLIDPERDLWWCNLEGGEGNALYGQRVWSQGAGFVPAERGESETFEVRAFGSLLESVQSYVVNLNRHYAYEDYRAMRALMRAHDTELDGLRLATTLANYSERRGAYVDALSGLIVSNRLDQFEDVQLSNAPIDPADTRLAAR